MQAARACAHTAFSLESREAVDALTQRLRGDGYAVASISRRSRGTAIMRAVSPDRRDSLWN